MQTTGSELTTGQRVILNGDSARVTTVRATLVGYTVELNDGRTVLLSRTATLTSC